MHSPVALYLHGKIEEGFEVTKISKYWKLKETGTNYDLTFFWACFLKQSREIK